jgi:Flp pilus assembly protein TadG
MDAHTKSRTSGDASIRAHVRDERGQAMYEFALILPFLCFLVLGMITFGLSMYNYQEMQNGVMAGAQALAISRGQTTNPCTTVSAPYFAATPNLITKNSLFTITITSSSGTVYTLANNTASPTCSASSTTAAPASDLTQGATASVTVTYPCNLNAFGVNFAPSSCVLTAQTAESVQ